MEVTGRTLGLSWAISVKYSMRYLRFFFRFFVQIFALEQPLKVFGSTSSEEQVKNIARTFSSSTLLQP